MNSPVLTFSAPSSTTLVLSWPAVSGATYYTLQYKTSEAGSWSTLSTTSDLTVSHTVTVNTLYYYRIAAVSGSETVWSEPVTARTFYPTSLSSAKTEEAITLTWAVSGVESCNVERSDDSGETWRLLASGVTGTTYIDSDFETNVNYLYRVTPDAATGVPRALTADVGVWKFSTLTAVPAGNDAILLTYDNDPNFIGNRIIQRSTNQTNWYLAYSGNSTTATSYTDSGLIPGTTFYYRANYSGNLYYRQVGPVTLPKEITNPATAVIGTAIVFSWDEVADATDYVVYRSTDQVTWTEYHTSQTTFSDSDVTTGTAFYYRVACVIGETEYLSDTVLGAVIDAPTNFAAARSIYNANYRFTLTWNAVSVPAGYGTVYYTLQYRKASDTDWTDLTTNNMNRSYVHTVSKNTWYHYRIRANGSPDWTELGPIWYPDVSELAPSLAFDTNGYPVISWTPITGAVGYAVARPSNASGTAPVIAELDADARTFTDYTATSNTLYYYRVGFAEENLWATYVSGRTGTINLPPTGITLSPTTISLPKESGYTVATLTASDPTSGETFTFALTEGDGDNNNADFAISGATLKTRVKLTAGTYRVRIRATDHGGLFAEKAFTLNVVKTALAPPELSASAVSDDTIRFTLGEVTNAAGYVVQYSTTLSFASFLTLTPRAGETLLSGLNSGTTYYFRVKSVGNDDYSDSAFTGVISAKTLIPITGVTLDNTTPDVGDIIRASVTPSGATVTWSWLRSGAVIEGATASSYTVTAADLGATIQAKTTATGDYYGTLETAPTGPVVDRTPPVITLSNTSDITVGLGKSVLFPRVTAVDNVDRAVTPTRTIVNGNGEVVNAVSTDRVDIFTVTWSATDSAGNTATASIHVNVVDNIPPTLTIHPYATLGTIHAVLSPGQEYHEFGASALDETDSQVPVTTSGTVGTATGIYTITYRAADSAGNTATAARTVVVSSEVSPVIADLACVRTADGITLSWTPIENIPVTIQRKTESGVWANLAEGIQAGTWTDSDGENDQVYFYRLTAFGVPLSNETQNYFQDTRGPTITLSDYGETGFPDAVLPLGATYVEYGASAIDAIDTDIHVEISGTVDTQTPGVYKITYTASDNAGHTSSATRFVLVHDDTPVLGSLQAVQTSQKNVRLTWPRTVRGMTLRVERREKTADDWEFIAEYNSESNSFNDTPPKRFIKYDYRLTTASGFVLTPEDVAWLIQVTHYSVVTQPVTTGVSQTKNVTWTTVTDITKKKKSITEVTFMTETIYRGESGVFCARIFDTNNTDRLLTQAEIDSISYTAYKITESLRSSVADRTAVEGHENIPVDKNETILEDAITDRYWTTDSIGYNFLHEPDTRAEPMFPEPGRYEVVYTIRLITGNPIPLTFSVTVS